MDALQEKVLSIVGEDIAEECPRLGDIAVGIPLRMHIARYLKELVIILSAKQGKDSNDCADGGC